LNRSKDIEFVNSYLTWRREKELYPPRWNPEDYVKELSEADARIRLELIADYLMSIDEPTDPTNEHLNAIHDMVFSNLDEVMDVSE
jgi:hypothetical protein